MSSSNAIYNLNGVPLFTYGMIGITIGVLAVVTMMDTDNDSFAKDEGYAKTEQSAPVTTNEKKEGSIFGNMFGSTPATDEKKEESIVESTSIEPPQVQSKTGGKYGNRKTKHNKRQNTYTRKH